MNKLAFGCSHTFGVGNNPEDAWPVLLGAINYGVPGSSTDLIARICEEKIQEYQANIVYAFWQTGHDLNLTVSRFYLIPIQNYIEIAATNG